MPQTGPRLLDAHGLARRFGVSVGTIRRWKSWGFIEVAAMRGPTPLYNAAAARRRMFDAVATGKKRVYIRPKEGR